MRINNIKHNKQRVSYRDRAKINKGFILYGQSVRISRSKLRLALFIFCMITPLTNWLILFSRCIKDITIRW